MASVCFVRCANDPKLAAMPVILLSARAGEEARVEGLEAGADDYLIKPFSARELIARVKSNLELVTLRRKVEDEVRERNTVLEDRVKERTAQLEESVKELQTFAYTVSHDLRAPIRGMYRYAEMLLSSYPGKVFDAQARKLRRGTSRRRLNAWISWCKTFSSTAG